MNPATQRVFRAAMDLPAEERLELVDALLVATSPAEGLPFDPSWLAVARLRSAEIDSGQAMPAPWAEARERVHRRQPGGPDDRRINPSNS